MLNSSRGPEVIRTLRVFQCSRMPLTVERAINDRLLANNTDDGHILTRPVPTIGNLVTDDEEPFNRLLDDLAGLDVRIGQNLPTDVGRKVRSPYNTLIVQRYELVFLLRSAVILSDADMVLVQPVAKVAQRTTGNLVLELRILFLDDVCWTVLKDETKAGIRPIKLIDVRIEIYAEGITHSPYVDFLIKRAVIRVVRDHTPIANARLYLEGCSRVIGALCVGDVFDMPDDTFEDISRFLGRTIAHRTHTNRRFVLAAVIHDL